MVSRYTLALGLALALTAARAAAEPSSANKEAAHSLMDRGDAMVEAKDLVGALRVYERADAIMGVPTTGIEVARTQAALGKLLQARETALRVSLLPVAPNEPAPFAQARRAAAELADRLVARLATLEVLVTGAGSATPEVSLDGERLQGDDARGHKLNPGEHRVRVSAKGYATVTRNIQLAEGERARVDLALVEDARPEAVGPAGTSKVVYAGLAVVGAGVALGTISGLLSLSKASSAKGYCTGNACTSEASPYIDSSRTYGTLANVFFGAAVLGGGVAVIGWLVGRDPSSPTSAGLASGTWAF